MKKSLTALAIFGAYASAAQAQSTVTVYGSIDGGLRYVTNVDARGNNKLSVGSNGTYNSNRLGFRGVEDVGGGMNVHFSLETGFNAGTGTSDSVGAGNSTPRLFSRTASVGIGGAWGNLDVGRMYSIAFKLNVLNDPFDRKYTGITPLAGAAAGGTSLVGAGTTASNFGGTRFDNNIQYSRKVGPVTGMVEYSPGEVAGSSKARSSSAAGLFYIDSQMTAGAVYTQKKVTPLFTAAAPGFDDHSWTLGASFKVDSFRFAGGYITEKIEGANAAGVAAAGDAKQNIAWLGGTYTIAPAVALTAGWYQTKIDSPAITAAAFTTGKKDLAVIGITYALSKRSSLYGEVDVQKLKGNQVLGFGTTTTQDRTSGVSLGLSHSF